jgi:lon-related putative ATP-dependent protease
MTDLREELRVPLDKLTWEGTLEGFVGRSTADTEPRQDIIGQDRAVKALRLGLGMKSFGYNIFVSGHHGSGRTAAVKRLLEERDSDTVIPNDLCYVNNFNNADQPRLLILQAGKGRIFKQQMADLIDSLQKKIPAIFESEEFHSARNEIVNRHMGEQKALFKNFENKVNSENFMMVQVQFGPFTRPDLAPVVVGNPMKMEQLESLVEEGKFEAEELEKIKEKYKELSRDMEQIFKKSREIDKSIQADLEELAKQWVGPLLSELVESIEEEHDSEEVKVYLKEVQADIVAHLDRFRPRLVSPGGGLAMQVGQGPAEVGGAPMLVPPDPEGFHDYEVNLLVDNSETKGAPVVFETTPTFRNLFGTVERVVDRTGLWSSDFRHIKAGSFLKANGGFLVLHARDTVTEMGVWQTLIRSLRNQVLEIQTDPYSFLFTSALKPEKIPISLRVIIIGEPEIYDILHWYDEDFRRIFKVKAEFDPTMPNTDDNRSKLVGFVANICSEENLLPLDPSGVEALTRLGVRLAGRKKKITAHFDRIADIVREADLRAREDGKELVSSSHVIQAHEDRIERVNMIEDKIQELIEDGILIIDTEGDRVGQINGLSVYSLPEFSFGRPSRITVKTSMGKSGIINIEREADLSGNSFNKGVLILAGFLRDRFAQDKPLNLTASICFEQSYSGVDGDSASSTELYALMSALSGQGIDQGIAVTGSVNQHGEVQPIGGVNEKIEGFFKVCKAKGLNGKQGVMIPTTNIGDLMLNSEVIQAVNEGQFHLWAVDHIDQGIELLTGTPAGQPDDEGNYPEDSINGLVNQRLEELSKGMKEFESSSDDTESQESKGTGSKPCDRCDREES